MINLYQSLGIPPTATAEQIQAAIEQAKETQKVPSVYLEKSQEWLLNSYIRARYDKKLREEHPEAFNNLSEPAPAEKKKPTKHAAQPPKPLAIKVPDIDTAFQERLHAHSEHIQSPKNEHVMHHRRNHQTSPNPTLTGYFRLFRLRPAQS